MGLIAFLKNALRGRKTVCVGCLQEYPSKEYPICGWATHGQCSDCGKETIVYEI